MQVLRLCGICIIGSCSRSTSTSWPNEWTWLVRIDKRTNSSAIYQSTVRNACTCSRVCGFRILHWWQEQAQTYHVVMSACVTHSSYSNTATSVPCTTWEWRRSSSLLELPDSIARKCQKIPIRWITLGEYTWSRERLSIRNLLSILFQELWKRYEESSTSCTCIGWVFKWLWSEALRSRAIHLHMLRQMQPTALIQQGELSVAGVLP